MSHDRKCDTCRHGNNIVRCGQGVQVDAINKHPETIARDRQSVARELRKLVAADVITFNMSVSRSNLSFGAVKGLK